MSSGRYDLQSHKLHLRENPSAGTFRKLSEAGSPTSPGGITAWKIDSTDLAYPTNPDSSSKANRSASNQTDVGRTDSLSSRKSSERPPSKSSSDSMDIHLPSGATDLSWEEFEKEASKSLSLDNDCGITSSTLKSEKDKSHTAKDNKTNANDGERSKRHSGLISYLTRNLRKHSDTTPKKKPGKSKSRQRKDSESSGDENDKSNHSKTTGANGKEVFLTDQEQNIRSQVYVTKFESPYEDIGASLLKGNKELNDSMENAACNTLSEESSSSHDAPIYSTPSKLQKIETSPVSHVSKESHEHIDSSFSMQSPETVEIFSAAEKKTPPSNASNEENNQAGYTLKKPDLYSDARQSDTSQKSKTFKLEATIVIDSEDDLDENTLTYFGPVYLSPQKEAQGNNKRIVVTPSDSRMLRSPTPSEEEMLTKYSPVKGGDGNVVADLSQWPMESHGTLNDVGGCVNESTTAVTSFASPPPPNPGPLLPLSSLAQVVQCQLEPMASHRSLETDKMAESSSGPADNHRKPDDPAEQIKTIQDNEVKERLADNIQIEALSGSMIVDTDDAVPLKPAPMDRGLVVGKKVGENGNENKEGLNDIENSRHYLSKSLTSSSSSSSDLEDNNNESADNVKNISHTKKESEFNVTETGSFFESQSSGEGLSVKIVPTRKHKIEYLDPHKFLIVSPNTGQKVLDLTGALEIPVSETCVLQEDVEVTLGIPGESSDTLEQRVAAEIVEECVQSSVAVVIETPKQMDNIYAGEICEEEENNEGKQEKGTMEICTSNVIPAPEDTNVENAFQQLGNAVDNIESKNSHQVNHRGDDEKEKITEECPAIVSSMNSSKTLSSSSSSEPPSSNLYTGQLEKMRNTSDLVEPEQQHEIDSREHDNTSIDKVEEIYNHDSENVSGDYITINSHDIECARISSTETAFQTSFLPQNEEEVHVIRTNDSVALTDPEEFNVLNNENVEYNTLHADLNIGGQCDLDKTDSVKIESTEPKGIEKLQKEENMEPNDENEKSLSQVGKECEKRENPFVSSTPISISVHKSDVDTATHASVSQNVSVDPKKIKSAQSRSSKSSFSSSSSSISSSHNNEASNKPNDDLITDSSLQCQRTVYPLEQQVPNQDMKSPKQIDTPAIAREKCSETITLSKETEPEAEIESVQVPVLNVTTQSTHTHNEQSTSNGIDGYLPDANHMVIEECVKPLSPIVSRAEPQLLCEFSIEGDIENQDKVTSNPDCDISLAEKKGARSSSPTGLQNDPSPVVNSFSESVTDDETAKGSAPSSSVTDNKEIKCDDKIVNLQPIDEIKLDKNYDAPCNEKDKEMVKSDKKEKHQKKSGNTSLSTASSSDSSHSKSSKISISKILRPIKRMISKDSDTYIINKSIGDEIAAEKEVESASETDMKSSEISISEPRTSTPRADNSLSLTSSQVDNALNSTLDETTSNISQEHTSPVAAPRRKKNKKHSDKDSSIDYNIESGSPTSSDSTPTVNNDTNQSVFLDTTMTSEVTKKSDDSQTAIEKSTDTEPHYSTPWQSGYNDALSAAMGQYASSICKSKEMSEQDNCDESLTMSISVDDPKSFDTDSTTKHTEVSETLDSSAISHSMETSEFDTSVASDAQSQNRKERKKREREKKKEHKEEKKEQRSKEKDSSTAKEERKRKDKKEREVKKEENSNEQKREKTKREKSPEKMKKKKDDDNKKSEEKKKSKDMKTPKSDSYKRERDKKGKKQEEIEKKVKERKSLDDIERKDERKSKVKKKQKEVPPSTETLAKSTEPVETTKSIDKKREKKEMAQRKNESKQSSSSSESLESGDKDAEPVIEIDTKRNPDEIHNVKKEPSVISKETNCSPFQQEPVFEATVHVQTASERPSQSVIQSADSVEYKEYSVPKRPPRTPKSKKSGRLSKLLPSIRSSSSKDDIKPDKDSALSDKDTNHYFDGTYHREDDVSAELGEEETKRMPRSSRILNTVPNNLPYIDEVEPSPVTTPVIPPPESTHFVVVAIDFGTSHSGYAFSFTRQPSSIYMMRMWAGEEPGVANQKTLTSLLLDPEGRFHSFGYNARSSYLNLIPLEARHWLYFSKFKMELHNNTELNRETMLVAANGIRFPALRVFAYSLEFFKDHALQQLSDQSGTEILNEDIRWVITVPAIWKAPAKQFMRQAAYDAGLAGPNFPEQLIIALEPEAASIYCRRLRMYQLVPDQPIKRPLQSPSRSSVEIANQDPAVTDLSIDSPRPSSSSSVEDPPDEIVDTKIKGSRYLVVDCGGGTVDITVHELDASGYIKELHRATGGPHGSVGVDTEFERLLCAIFGLEFIEHYKRRYPMGWVHLMTDFESRKRSSSPYKTSFLNISPPFTFIHEYKKHKSDPETAIKKYGDPGVEWSPQGMIRLSPVAMRKLFLPTVTRIKQEIGDVLNHPNARGLKYFFLVGGFAESPLLQYELRQEFNAIIKPLIPVETSLAVLKGAVQFGIDPSIVRVRRSRLTYGVGILNRFDAKRHPESKRVRRNGVDWCTDIFDKYVETDQPVMLWNTVARSYTPAKPGQESIVLNIYSSHSPNVRFITDPGVVRCGTLCLNLAQTHSLDEEKRVTEAARERASSPREIRTRMSFGDTEINVIAVDVDTGRVVKASVDFLGR